MSIPSVDLHDYTQPPHKATFVATIGKAFNEIGFIAVKNHGLTSKEIDHLYTAYKAFFALDQPIKDKYDIEGGAGQRGYTGKKKETAKGFKAADLKEFYHVGQENKPKEPNLAQHYSDNVWPKEVPALKDISLTVYTKLEKAGISLLRAIALYLELPENYFDDKVMTGNSILRAIHYFPLTNEADSEAVRAAAHEDINLITLLMGASAEGLEIQKKDGSWVAVTALPDQIVVNIGDMLARLTNNKLKSTTHRVVNPEKSKRHLSRYSMPFFMHPRADMDLTCLPSCISNTYPKQYTDITAGDYLMERLRELGLLK